MMFDLISSQRPSEPIVKSFSKSRKIIRSSVRPIISPIHRQKEPDIVILESWTTNEVQVEANAVSNDAENAQIMRQKKQISVGTLQVELPPQTSPFRPKRHIKRFSIYQGDLIQPLKRRKH